MQNLFIAGVMRSGTTYLATILDEHPSICFAKPIVPERKHFLIEQKFQKGKDYYETHSFIKNGDISVCGEKTVHYSERPDSLERIFSWYPDAKMILLLRNPVHRAISNYLFSVDNGLETRSPEEVFLRHTPEPDYNKERFFISPFNYLHRGEYLTAVQLISRYVRPGNLVILISEKTVGRLDQISRLYSLLGVDSAFSPPSLKKKIFSNSKRSETIDRNIITYLYRYYKLHNQKLQDFTGLDLSCWNEEQDDLSSV